MDDLLTALEEVRVAAMIASMEAEKALPTDHQRRGLLQNEMTSIQGKVVAMTNMLKPKDKPKPNNRPYGSPSSWAMAEMEDEEWMNEGKKDHE